MTGLLPDFRQPPFRDAPPARFEPAPAAGVMPEDFFSTSKLPTYVLVDGTWKMPTRPRMDGVIVRRGAELETVEPRRVRQGDEIAHFAFGSTVVLLLPAAAGAPQVGLGDQVRLGTTLFA